MGVAKTGTCRIKMEMENLLRTLYNYEIISMKWIKCPPWSPIEMLEKTPTRFGYKGAHLSIVARDTCHKHRETMRSSNINQNREKIPLSWLHPHWYSFHSKLPYFSMIFWCQMAPLSSSAPTFLFVDFSHVKWSILSSNVPSWFFSLVVCFLFGVWNIKI